MAADRRRYQQYCGVAHALDVLGERWTLLIVRDLLPGPRRYGQLAERLPGIATDILTARLRTLEEHGLVTSRREPGRGGPVSYRLTDEGQELRPVVEALADVGARWLGSPLRPDVRADLGWALSTAAAALRPGDVPATPLVVGPERARPGLVDAGVEGGQRYLVERDGNRVALRYLVAPPARHVALEGPAPALLGLLSGHLAPDDAGVEARGDARTIARWREALGRGLPAASRPAPDARP